MRPPSSRTRRVAFLSAGPLTVVLASLMIWQGSQAAFTATTRNSGNAWSTGSVTLTDDDAGKAAFTAENLVPGATGQKCIVVTSASTVRGTVKAYVQNLATSPQKLEDRIVLKVEQGTGGSFNNCAGFTPDPVDFPASSLSTLAATNNNYATSVLPWATAGTPGEKKSYRGTWTFDTSGLTTQQQIDALQGARTSIDIVWELQSR